MTLVQLRPIVLYYSAKLAAAALVSAFQPVNSLVHPLQNEGGGGGRTVCPGARGRSNPSRQGLLVKSTMGPDNQPYGVPVQIGVKRDVGGYKPFIS